MGRVFSTGKWKMIRVSQYLINGLKGECKGLEYSKNLKKPLSSSTGMTSETLIYHNACNSKIVHQHKKPVFITTFSSKHFWPFLTQLLPLRVVPIQVLATHLQVPSEAHRQMKKWHTIWTNNLHLDHSLATHMN